MSSKPSERKFGEILKPSVDPDTIRKIREELEALPPLRRVVKPAPRCLTTAPQLTPEPAGKPAEPEATLRIGKWVGIFGMVALGALGAEVTNGKILPALERSAAQSELLENRGLLIRVMDQTASAMAFMKQDKVAISTKKQISVYYDAPKNLFYSKVGFKKDRFSEKVLEFEGQLFFNNRATGEGNVWFSDTKILISLDDYEGAFPDNKCNIPDVPKSSCMTGLVLFDLTFQEGQISSVAVSTLVGNKNAFNADSDGNLGVVNAGKRSLGITLTDHDLLARVKTLYNGYLLLKQGVKTEVDPKPAEAVHLAKSKAFQKKLLDGTVVYNFVSSNGNRDSCAGFVYANDVIVTAKHCLMGGKSDSNDALLETVMSVSKDRNDIVRQHNIWTRGSSKYQYAFSGYRDLGVIVFDKIVFPKAKLLGISEEVLTANDRFIFGHVVRTEGEKYWRSEFGPALAQRDNYDLSDPYWLKFNFGLQKGNSGGAAVDANGDVVSVLRNYCDYDKASSNGKFCGDKVTKKDVTILIAEAKKKLAEL